MTSIDFTECPLENNIFTGTERKICVSRKGIRYLLKFQKEDQFGLRNNHISEHLGSSIFSMVGITAQKTCLGTYGGKNVVACRIFTDDETKFVPFDDVGESSLDYDTEHTGYTYEDIMFLLKANRKLTSVESTVDAFWDMFIIDGLLGNFDRHGRNWGFLKNDDRYRLAPVFDNGSCLYPKMTDENEMRSVMESREETDRRIFGYPTSQIRLDGKKSSYSDVIGSLRFEECNKAVLRMYPRIDIMGITDFINGVEQLTPTQKGFYTHMITERFEKIIRDSYDKMVKK